MRRTFNTDGYCDPELHYMVDLTDRLREIRAMVEAGKYFTINRARQYGKTTILTALADELKTDYNVISLDFQGLSTVDFESEKNFAAAFSRQVLLYAENMSDEMKEELGRYVAGSVNNVTLSMLFMTLLGLCRESQKKIVLLVDEVDSATNNQVFLDFLAQLRFFYLRRRRTPLFHSVILAGVYDIRSIRRKLRPDEEHKENSPWNISADFNVSMSFSAEDIAGMLTQYEKENKVGMDIGEISGLIYDYTSGYPFLVSRLCKSLDEKMDGISECKEKEEVWTRAGVLEAVKILVSEKNTLFESLIGKLNGYPGLKVLIYQLLFQGQFIICNSDDPAINMLLMFGFAKEMNGTVQIANRIFEIRLYNYFLTLTEIQNGEICKRAIQDKKRFIQGGQLNMEHILERFVEHFNDIYGDQEQKFLEEDGRRYFMLYLKPIINGSGNYYVEARTRNQERTDLIIDYCGTQYVVEMKVWRGNAYNERGEEQLINYLEYYHLKKGYMLSFNFNKKKEIGLKEIQVGDKTLIEAVV